MVTYNINGQAQHLRSPNFKNIPSCLNNDLVYRSISLVRYVNQRDTNSSTYGLLKYIILMINLGVDIGRIRPAVSLEYWSMVTLGLDGESNPLSYGLYGEKTKET